jgi:hypothetical protein
MPAQPPTSEPEFYEQFIPLWTANVMTAAAEALGAALFHLPEHAGEVLVPVPEVVVPARRTTLRRAIAARALGMEQVPIQLEQYATRLLTEELDIRVTFRCAVANNQGGRLVVYAGDAVVNISSMPEEARME